MFLAIALMKTAWEIYRIAFFGVVFDILTKDPCSISTS